MNGHEAIYQKYNDPDTCPSMGFVVDKIVVIVSLIIRTTTRIRHLL